MSRNDIRSAVLGAKPEKKLVVLFGQEIEFTQPSVEEVLKLQQSDDPADTFVGFMIKYARVPETHEQVFDDTDRDALKALPFGPEFDKINRVVLELTSADAEAEKAAVGNSKGTPSNST